MNTYIDVENIFNAAAVAVPTAWLTAYFSIKKYRSEKWWDKKLTAYLSTINAINDLVIYCDSVIDIEYEEINYSKDQIKSLERRFHDARMHIQAQANIGKLLYGKSTFHAIFELNNSLFSAERMGNLVQRAAEIRGLAESCIETVTDNARKYLRVNNYWRN